jgi:hypothetical protein
LRDKASIWTVLSTLAALIGAVTAIIGTGVALGVFSKESEPANKRQQDSTIVAFIDGGASLDIALLEDVRIDSRSLKGYERVIFVFERSAPSGQVEYAGSAFACAAGARLPLGGSGVLEVSFNMAAQHNDLGNQTFIHTAVQGNGGTIVEARRTCDVGGRLTWAIGTQGEKPFHIEREPPPGQVIINIRR